MLGRVKGIQNDQRAGLRRSLLKCKRFWVLVAGVLIILRGAISNLPSQRPPDFAMHYHSASVFGQTLETFDISATTCHYRLRERGQVRQSFDCALNATQLDTVYAAVRQVAFDQIRYIPIPALGSDRGGEFYTEVTANGRTYRKSSPTNYCCTSIGVARYNRVQTALFQLIDLYRETRPAAFIVYFKEHVEQAKIDAFTLQLTRHLSKHKLGIAGAIGKQIGGHHSITIQITQPMTQAQRDELQQVLSTTPIVYRILENMVPSHVQTLDQ